MGIFEELFHPNARIRDEEKNRVEWMRDETGLGDPFHGPIDLDTGVVKMLVEPDGTPDHEHPDGWDA